MPSLRQCTIRTCQAILGDPGPPWVTDWKPGTGAITTSPPPSDPPPAPPAGRRPMAPSGKKRARTTKATMCGDKTRYPGKAAAEQARRRHITAGTSPGAVKTCQCPHCGSWHAGRKYRPDLRQVQNRARHRK